MNKYTGLLSFIFGIILTVFVFLSWRSCNKNDEGINILMISTSEIKISVIIEENYLELAVRSLHTAFGLDREHGESSARA